MPQPIDEERDEMVKGKLIFGAGLAVGFVLGTRAGRGQYEKIKQQASSLWEDPRVSEVRAQAAEKVGDIARQAPAAAAAAARTAAEKVGEVVEERRERADDADADGPSPAAEADVGHAPDRARSE